MDIFCETSEKSQTLQVTFREVEVEVVLSPRLDLHLAREHVLVEPHADQLLGQRLLQLAHY